MILSLVPQPLLLLDTLFVRFLAHSIMRVSEASIDFEQATKRIRRLEILEPLDSARLFASISFVASVVWGAADTGSISRMLSVALLGSISGWLANRDRDAVPPKLAALAVGLASIYLIT